ncbi:FAD-binding 8 [Macrophomina phaseolina MS6]|uniref:ferric-chelate reductase (NADPH) n=1 Tax=Macrophomina phaseolina (strain MS6) TaxID=1126212 RepID=K2R4K9_MACPH|nr:FAD-binding 8 [Macrophomina phaseolina MS6]
MDITYIYCIAVGGLVALIGLVPRLISIAKRVWRTILVASAKHLALPYVVGRHRHLGPWTRLDVLIWVAFFATNLFCVAMHVSSWSEAGRRAASLCLVNMIPLYGGTHVAHMADTLGVSRRTYLQIHRIAGVATLVAATFHVCVMLVARESISSENRHSLMALIVFGIIAITSFPPLRKYWYESFLRIHQLSSIVAFLSLLWHVPSGNTFFVICQTITAAIFLIALIAQVAVMVYRNDLYHGGPTVRIGGSKELLQIDLELRKPLRTEPGQYVNLWIPSLSTWSFAQSHPFAVASWSEAPASHLRLVVKPFNGLTRKMAESVEQSTRPRRALFSGPHGKKISLAGYSNVVMIATGLGIFAQLPYLQKLAHCEGRRQRHGQRIHVVWYMSSNSGAPMPDSAYDIAKDVINDALGKNHNIYTSFYKHSLSKDEEYGGRVKLLHGPPPLGDIFDEEARELGKKGKMLVLRE